MKENMVHIAELMVQLQGIDIAKFDGPFLEKSLQKRITETHCDSVDGYYKLLEQNHNEAKAFIDSLQIHYSEFCRNTLTFATLEHIILPMLVYKNNLRKEIRIWSAACAGGQEAYSLAMICEEIKSQSHDKFKYRIFATDQNEVCIDVAERGRYPGPALNRLKLKHANQWFSKHNDMYTVKPALKSNIDFTVFNLFDGKLICPPASIFGDFDLIVCANLLFYYGPAFRKIIIEKLTASLADGGYLVTGETERDILMKFGYDEIFPQSAIFQKK